MAAQDHLGQPIGPALSNWTPPPRPPRIPLAGAHCRLDPLDPALHARALFEVRRAERAVARRAFSAD